MGRRNLNFQLFRKGWQLCHNASGEMTSRFPSTADELLDETDFSAYIRDDVLDADRMACILRELRRCAGSSCGMPLSSGVQTDAIVTTESFVGCGGQWCYASSHAADNLPIAAILYWLGDFLAGSERRTLQSDPQAARLAAQWMVEDTAVFFHPSMPRAMDTVSAAPASSERAPVRRSRPAARSKSWQSIMAVMAGM